MRTCAAVAFFLLLAGTASAADGFAGSWDTTFGPMTLSQDGVSVRGSYVMDGERCTIDGKVVNNRLTFRYQEPGARGEGWFELAADGKSFSGKWRAGRSPDWAEWTGTRTAAAPEVSWLRRLLAAAGRGGEFAGLWDTTYGRMRLVQNGDKVTGIYSLGGGSTIEGTVRGGKLTLDYKEPEARGSATFELSADGDRFQGKWKPVAGSGGNWTGERVVPKPGLIWLVVVEARWEANLTDDEYSFGGMLKAFFARSSRVQVRHRYFTDEASLKRWCGEMAYVAEPAVLVVASHGSTRGVAADGKTVPAAALAESLKLAGNLKLLHFSACEIMKDKAAEGIMAGVEKSNRFPISGYTTVVDWAGSAIIEFAYLDMVLVRGMSPAKAAEQLKKLLPFSGTNAVPGSAFGNAGFRLLLPD